MPASTTPVQDYADRPAPGATADHIVVPRSLAQSMPLRWQQVFVGLLADLHDAYGDLPWPDYAVVPSRWEYLVDLDEEQLAARASTPTSAPTASWSSATRPNAWCADPARHRVLAPVDDPMPPASAGARVEPRPGEAALIRREHSGGVARWPGSKLSGSDSRPGVRAEILSWQT